MKNVAKQAIAPFEHCVATTASLSQKVAMKMVTMGQAVTTCSALNSVIRRELEADLHHRQFTLRSLSEPVVGVGRSARDAVGDTGSFSKFSLYIVKMIDVFQRSSRNYRKLFGLITCGSVRSRVSATLVIDVREWFFSAACRLFISGRGARCTVLSWRRSCCPGSASCCRGLEVGRCGRDQQGDDMADRMTHYFHAHNDDAAILSPKPLEPEAHM